MVPKWWWVKSSKVCKLTLTRLVSGSAMTPTDFKARSPILRVIANLPFTCGWPRLFHETNPPHFFILSNASKTKSLKDETECEIHKNSSMHSESLN